MPPPASVAKTSKRPAWSVTSKGCITTNREVSRGKYASKDLRFTAILPVPGWSQTRATAVLRLPVAYQRFTSSPTAIPPPLFPQTPDSDQDAASPSGLDALEWLGLLGLMGVIRSTIHLELLDHSSRQLVLREHARDGDFDDAFRFLRQKLISKYRFKPTRIPGMPRVEFLLPLVAGQLHLARVDDNN